MKTLFKVLIIFSLSIAHRESDAQDFDYFENNPIWKVTSICSQGYPCIASSAFNYILEGDSMINGLEYRVLFSIGQTELMWFANPPAGCSGSSTFNYVAGFVRTGGKKIFFIPNNET